MTKKSAGITQQPQRDFEDVFNGTGCFEGTFSLQLKPDSKPYQVPQRCMVYELQKPFKGEMKRLQKQYIIAHLGVDETSEWCNSFVLVPKANGKVRLCLDPAQLIHRGPPFSDILPKLNIAKYLSLTDVGSGYHNLN